MSSTRRSLVHRVSKRDANRAAHKSAQQAVAQNIESMVPGDWLTSQNTQQLIRTRGQPLGARVPLALGTVPIAARVEGDGLMAAASAFIEMTAQCRGAATNDGIEHLVMHPCKVRLVLVTEAAACCADDVGHLEGGPAHRFRSLLERFTSSGLDTSMASSGLATACRWRRDRCR